MAFQLVSPRRDNTRQLYAHPDIAGISDCESEALLAHEEQDASSHRGRRLVAVTLSAVALLGVVGAVKRPATETKPSPFAHTAGTIAAWSVVPNSNLPPPASVPGAWSDCSQDVIVQTGTGSLRITAAQYSNKPVAFMKATETHGVTQCETTYVLECKDNQSRILGESCDGDKASASGLQNGFTTAVGSQQSFPKQFHASPQNVIAFFTSEMASATAGTVQVFSTKVHCDSLPSGTCQQGCCSEGFQCVFENILPKEWRSTIGSGANKSHDRGPLGHLGVCAQTEWQPSQVCTNVADVACEALVSRVTKASTNWNLILTSAGGGGHWSAATNLKRTLQRQWRTSIDTLQAELASNLQLLTPFGQRVLQTVVTRVVQDEPPVVVIDVMSSPCTNLFGRLGGSAGHFMSSRWDVAQQKGEIANLNGMLKHQFVVDRFFYQQCLDYMTLALRGDVGLGHKLRIGPPTRLVSTEPMMMGSIVRAVKVVAEEIGTLKEMDLYTTDLPGVDARLPFNFWHGINRIAKYHPEMAQYLRVHTVAPISGGAAAIASSCGLNQPQVIIEPFLPVNHNFIERAFPLPGTATTFGLKAQIPEEKAFLGGDTKDISIGASDIVVLIMLGSHPTIQAMKTYIDQAATLKQPPSGRLRWIFFASGPHTDKSYRDLYIHLSKQAAELNKHEEATGGRLRFMPFTGQPAQAIEARAEVTVTRSGGITAGELLALTATGGKKDQVFLHIEDLPTIPPRPPCCDARKEAEWEDAALKNGMVDWEGGNARYLMAKADAQLVTPSTFASKMKYPDESREP